jgi:hypothetical protein
MSNILHALFVAWQDPDTRRFYPVARLSQITGNGCEDCFEFVYLQGMQEAELVGFQPFVSFPDRNRVYRSKTLFPMFDNRLISQKRADFPEYIAQLGLPPASNSPITILSRSAGRRATDTLELFPLPEFEADYGYRTWFWAHGLRHLPSDGHARMLVLTPEEQVFPHCETSNAVDSSAIELLSHDGLRIGYMPSYLLDDAHTLQETCEFCDVFIERLNLPPAPIQQRLLCRLESCWPEGFIPYSSSRYQPLSKAASILQPPVFD